MSETTNRKKDQTAAEENTAAARTERKKAKKPLSPKEKQRRIVIALLAVVAALLCVAVAITALFQRPDLPSHDGDGLGEELVGPKADGDRKEDFFTFLVIGRDTGGGGNTDTVLLAAYDVKNQEMNVMSIPRDTMVNVNWDVKKINSVYNFNGGGEEGIQALYKEVSELVGFVPDYSVIVEWEAVGELVDAIGGVWYEVPRDMDYEDPAQDLSIHVKKGYQKLNGEQAMGVVRFREGKNGYATGDLGRIETQQGFLKALIEQCLKIDKMTKVTEYARIFTEQVTTDLTINNLAWFGQQAIFGGLKSENVNFITMPCTTKSVWSRSYKANLSYVVPNVEELVQVVNERFNPYLEELTSAELDIMFVNSDGTIGCTSGRLQDTKANASLSGRPSSSPTVNTETTEPVEPDVPVEPTEPNNTAPDTPKEPDTPDEITDPGESGTENGGEGDDQSSLGDTDQPADPDASTPGESAAEENDSGAESGGTDGNMDNTQPADDAA